jgi:hypothetical protein
MDNPSAMPSPDMQKPKSNLPTIITIFALILSYPIGLLVMWFWAPWSTKTKTLVTVVPMALIIVLSLLSWMTLSVARRDAATQSYNTTHQGYAAIRSS